MSQEVNQPLFTLRGHNVGVTALAQFEFAKNPFLISGDDEGTINVWDLNILRRHVSHSNVASSRIQTLRIVKFCVNDVNNSHLLIVQFRDNGLKLFNIESVMSNFPLSKSEALATYPTFNSLFSRGDALDVDHKVALLAYPSCMESDLVTVRVIGQDAKTYISGNAQRHERDSKRTCTVFDISIVKKSDDSFHLFIGYEDGCICCYTFNLNVMKVVPHLKVEGLKIDLIKTYNFQVGDFLSAFAAVNRKPDNNLVAVCGFPKAELIFLCDLLDGDQITEKELNVKRIKLRKPGVAEIQIRPDNKLVAVACWDSSVRLYSLEAPHKLLTTLNLHMKQVQSMVYAKRPEIHADKDSYANEVFGECAGLSKSNEANEGLNKYLLCCASIEGTISISAIQ